MTIKMSYVADDGTIFKTEQECVEYEARKLKKDVETATLLNRVCKFYCSKGNRFQIDTTFKETDIYGVNLKCSVDEIEEVMSAFSSHFDDLYFALEASDFQCYGEAILVYDWTGSGRGWMEIDYEHQEWFSMVAKVMERA